MSRRYKIEESEVYEFNTLKMQKKGSTIMQIKFDKIDETEVSIHFERGGTITGNLKKVHAPEYILEELREYQMEER